MLLHAIVSGRVQGVGFRYFTQDIAKSLNIKGFVRNLPDGTVEVYAQADKKSLEKFLEYLKKGPPLAKVENIKYEFLDKEGGFKDFEIRY